MAGTRWLLFLPALWLTNDVSDMVPRCKWRRSCSGWSEPCHFGAIWEGRGWEELSGYSTGSLLGPIRKKGIRRCVLRCLKLTSPVTLTPFFHALFLYASKLGGYLGHRPVWPQCTKDAQFGGIKYTPVLGRVLTTDNIAPVKWYCMCIFHPSWVPVFFDESQKLAVMSIGFLLQNRDDAVVWRGPKKNGI